MRCLPVRGECPALDIHGYPPAERLATITTRVQFAPLSPSEIERFVSNVIGISLPLLQRWLVGISPS
ncbi:Septum formation protein Maf [Synechococcus sp. WH 8101]|nr:Septum formation protein Maf [Synechococcus sp. WH 8101]QNI44615.1 hypothetical protein SynRCC2555_00827 [Synechococcus sp. WH 8101]